MSLQHARENLEFRLKFHDIKRDNYEVVLFDVITVLHVASKH